MSSNDFITIKGKEWFVPEVEDINAEASKLACPFSCTSATIIKKPGGALIPTPGLSPALGFENTFECFRPCLGMSCMAFDPETKSCLRLK